MKKRIIVSLILTAVIFTLPLLNGEVEAGEGSPETEPPVKKAERLKADEKRDITLLYGDETVSISVRDYLIGVVAAEMPAGFEPEALKAQSVAARTYLQRALETGSRHGGADICSDPGCCQAYKTREELLDVWGDKFDEYIVRIESAVDGTDGKYLSYAGEPALAAFHSSSSGTTENSSALWSELPYLISVDTPETESDVPNFVSTLYERDIDFRDTVLYARQEADMTGEAEQWISEIKRDEAGRVESVTVGGSVLSGEEMRTLFGLRSTDFLLEHTDGGFSFTVYGYGHGIGMSQYGANVMARNGADHKEILSHYYPGTVLI